MGKKTIPAGEIIEVSDNDGSSVYDVETVEGDIRFASRKRLVPTGRRLREGSSVQLELEGGEDLFLFNPNSAQATIEVTNL